MFKKVNTRKELRIFKSIWLEVCRDKGFDSDPFYKDADRFLIQSPDGNYIGTIEIRPYHVKTHIEKFKLVTKSHLEDYYTFSAVPEIYRNHHTVFEIDKLCIKKEYRNEGFLRNIFHLIIFYGIKNDATHFIAVIDSLFYRSLLLLYKVKVKRLRTNLEYKQFDLVPMYFDLKYFLHNVNEYKNWFDMNLFSDFCVLNN